MVGATSWGCTLAVVRSVERATTRRCSAARMSEASELARNIASMRRLMPGVPLPDDIVQFSADASRERRLPIVLWADAVAATAREPAAGPADADARQHGARVGGEGLGGRARICA